MVHKKPQYYTTSALFMATPLTISHVAHDEFIMEIKLVVQSRHEHKKKIVLLGTERVNTDTELDLPFLQCLVHL